MASSFTAMFGNMDTYGLPDHLIEHVAKHYHMSQFKQIQSQIQTNYSEFEKIFMEYSEFGVNALITAFKRLYPDFKIYVDMGTTDSNWLTFVFKLTKNKFILFHEHQYYGRNQRFFMEGEIIKKRVFMTRFVNVYSLFQYSTKDLGINCYKIKDYFSFRTVTLFPFIDLKNAMMANFSVDAKDLKNTFQDSPQSKQSIFSKNIIDWFVKNKNILVRYYNEHREEPNVN